MNSVVEPPQREIATVLFMDIVGYSRTSNDEQTELLTILQKIVEQSPEFQKQHACEVLIPLPTGDGMAIVFLGDPISPVQCALDISTALKNHPELELRMGINMGLVSRHVDIKKEVNVVGGGINMAQRVMDCGDAGHILLSQSVADVLAQTRGWDGSLKDLGVVEVKHGVQIHLYNLWKDGLGNPATPRKIDSPLKANRTLSRRKLAGWIALTLVALSMGWLLYRRGDVTRASWDANLLKRRQDPSSASAAMDDSLIGVTLWRLRPSQPGDDKEVRSLIHEETLPREWTPERISVDTPLKQGQKIMVTIETARDGYLYVIDRDEFADGSRGAPYLIFPTQRIHGGDNQVAGGTLIHIPSAGDIPPYFTVQRDSPNQVAEVITIVVSAQPIEQLQNAMGRQEVPKDFITNWETKWKEGAQRLELAAQAGKPYTLAEKQAGARSLKLTPQDPLPMTMYHVNAKHGDPLLIDVPLRIAS
jgi:Adenylate and Guanylate cyclase catalytic domain/Domain of unknown function (DUF4384)